MTTTAGPAANKPSSANLFAASSRSDRHARPVRESFACARPELHLLAWDAGVYQLKHLWREHFAEDWEALRASHKRLADKLRPGVYDFGFLLR